MLLLVLSNMAKVSNKFSICAINSSERKARGLDFSFDTFFYSWNFYNISPPSVCKGQPIRRQSTKSERRFNAVCFRSLMSWGATLRHSKRWKDFFELWINKIKIAGSSGLASGSTKTFPGGLKVIFACREFEQQYYKSANELRELSDHSRSVSSVLLCHIFPLRILHHYIHEISLWSSTSPPPWQLHL